MKLVMKTYDTFHNMMVEVRLQEVAEEEFKAVGNEYPNQTQLSVYLYWRSSSQCGRGLHARDQRQFFHQTLWQHCVNSDHIYRTNKSTASRINLWWTSYCYCLVTTNCRKKTVLPTARRAADTTVINVHR